MHGTILRTNNNKIFKVLQISPNLKHETGILQNSNINTEGDEGAALFITQISSLP